MQAIDTTLDLPSLFGARKSLQQRPEFAVADTREELSEVYRLTHASYVASGYAAPHVSRMLIHYPYFDHLPETQVLVARIQGEIIGTVSYTMDGPCGLPVDEDFRARCDAERQAGKKVACVWRLVVKDEFRAQRDIVMGLIHTVVAGLVEHGAESVFFSVNPRHVKVYCKMLNMEVVAENECTKGLSNAPATLLLGSPANLPQRINHPDDRYGSPVIIPVILNLYDF